MVDVNLFDVGRERSMTMREYYAGLAMQGLATCRLADIKSNRAIAEWAVVLADALIEELNKKGD